VTAVSGRARGRVAWGLLDQVVSSAANFVVTVLAARALSPHQFGAFVVAMAVCLVTITLVRGLASDSLATAHSADEPAELRLAVRSALSAAIAAALLVAAIAAGVSLVAGAGLRSVLLVVAVIVPGLVAQDYLRYALIVLGRPQRTTVNDLVWGVLQVPLLLYATARHGGAAALLFAWGLAGGLCCLLGMAQAAVLPGGPRTVGRWLRRHRRLWPYFVLDNAVYQASNFGLVLVMSLATSLAQVGALRAAMTVYAPLTVIGRGLVGVAVPEIVRRRTQPRAVRRGALLISWATVPCAAVWTAGTLLLPEQAGRALFGATWPLARPLVLLTGIGVAGGLFSVGVVVGLRALAAAKEGLNARLVITALVLSGATAGAVLDGAHGVVVALALLAPVQVAVWWLLLDRATAARPRHSLQRAPLRLGVGSG
jgi:O-antigen/teichoic acid export membrane protein